MQPFGKIWISELSHFNVQDTANKPQCKADRIGEAPAYAGTDFIIARDGRIAAVYLFFDELP
jgi:hypothetical protein